ncbi:MAG: hypothetical protein HC868_13135 [Sphingomonadales bacterium]|nr:hypothetical protein [Sphingomonadales bacterium]
MRNPWPTVAIASAVAATALTASALYADSTHDKGGPMMGEGGMMGSMEQMRGMMEGCSRMMGMRGGRSERPNEQWRTPAPSVPDKKS